MSQQRLTRAARRGSLRWWVPVAAALMAAGAGSAGSLAQDRTILLGAAVVQPDGTLAPNMAVVIVNGKIASVVSADQVKAGEKDDVVRLGEVAGAVISPGLIDLMSGVGAMGDTTEQRGPVDPGLSAVDAVQVASRSLGEALRAGITTVMVAPGENNVVAGAAATYRTLATDGRADVLRADGPMVFVLSSSVLTSDREPTSRAGAGKLLRDALRAGKSGKGDARLGAVVGKTMDAVVVCEAPEDVDMAARTFGEYGLTPTLAMGEAALDVAGDMAGSSATVVVGPLTFGSSLKSLLGPARLSGEGVELAFSGRAPMLEPAGLRVTASLAVRYGMDVAAARRGLSRNAARVAGVSDRVGTLESGKDADIVVFSGDPLRLDSKVLQVYVKGVRAYTHEAKGTDGR